MNNKTKLGIIGLGIVLLFIMGAGLYFFRSDEKTPEFAIDSVEKSVASHDKQTFYKFVNIESVLDSSYDEIVEGLTDSDKSMSIEAREAVKNFTQMLKSPLILSLKSAIDSYVETGEFSEPENLGIKSLLTKTGIDKIEFRGIENISTNSANEKEAFADVKIFQPELGREFVLKVVLNMNDKGEWQIVGLQNFRDFVMQIGEVRRAQLLQYLARTDEINSAHDQVIRDAEQKYSSILALGSLGQESTRSDLKNLMLDVVKKDWEARKKEFFSLTVPSDAETLHNLRIKICDLEIEYATEYAEWMSDKKAATIKAAEEKRRQAQTLMTEANVLARRMAN